MTAQTPKNDDVVAPPSFDDVEESLEGAPTDVDVEPEAVEEPTGEESAPAAVPDDADAPRTDEPGTDEEPRGG